GDNEESKVGEGETYSSENFCCTRSKLTRKAGSGEAGSLKLHKVDRKGCHVEAYHDQHQDNPSNSCKDEPLPMQSYVRGRVRNSMSNSLCWYIRMAHRCLLIRLCQALGRREQTLLSCFARPTLSCA